MTKSKLIWREDGEAPLRGDTRLLFLVNKYGRAHLDFLRLVDPSNSFRDVDDGRLLREFERDWKDFYMQGRKIFDPETLQAVIERVPRSYHEDLLAELALQEL